MVFQLTLPTLLGIIIGAVVFLLCLAVGIVFICLRIKHRRLLAKTNAAGERRLSRYPGGHLNITDEDATRIPGTGAAMRESLGNRYTRASAYAPMASREAIGQQPGSERNLAPAPITDSRNMPKVIVKDGNGDADVHRTRPWPLPRRLARANRPPVMELHSSNLSPIAEVKKGDAPLNGMMKPKGPKMVPRQEYADTTRAITMPGNPRILNSNPEQIAAPTLPLIPKPLFHEKPRSISHGMISKLSGNKKPTRGLYVFEAQEPLANPPPRPHMARSTSLTNQEPGTAPTGPMPTLPPEAMAIRSQRSIRASNSRQSLMASNSRQSLIASTSRQSLIASTSRQSLGGTVWRDTTVMDGGNSLTFPQNEPNVKTTTFVPQLTADILQNDGDPFKESRPLMEEAMEHPPVSPTVARTRTLKSPLDSRKSLRASIRNSIPRSNSSGLSESLLNHSWSRSASNNSMVREISNAPARSKTLGPHISIFDFGLPPSDVGDVGTHQLDLDDIQSKRKSTSILAEVSGNEQSSVSHPYNERPSSIATENPLRWDADLLVKEAAAKRESTDGRGHKRQNCIRMSIEPDFASPQLPPPTSPQKITKQAESQEKRSLPEAQSLRRPRKDPPAFRPPSRSTFDPQLTPTPHSNAAAARTTKTSPYFKTLAKLTGYDDSNSSPASIIDTPTRKSGARPPSGKNPNRQRTILDGPSTITQWPLAGQHPTLSLGLRGTSESPERANIFQLDAQLNPPTPTKDYNESRPPSLLFRFPSPPSPTRIGPLSHHRQPSAQASVQGPRPAPASNASHHSSKRYSSPTKNPAISKHTSGSPGNQLRQSVIALRRMNSEVSEVGKAGREHKRYLSLGDRESAIFEHDTDFQYRPVPRGPRAVPAMEPASVKRDSARSQGQAMVVEGWKRNDAGARIMGPRAMPSWVDDESTTVTPGREVRVTAGGVVGTDGSWYDTDGFLKQHT